MRIRSFELAVIVDNRRVEERWDSDRAMPWIIARRNTDFQLELVNHSKQRAVAVVSVDGLSIMDRKPAGVLHSSGYIVRAGAHMRIPGWRVSDSAVDRFRFTRVAGSEVVVQEEDLENIGVIASAWFEEKEFVADKPQLDTLMRRDRTHLLADVSSVDELLRRVEKTRAVSLVRMEGRPPDRKPFCTGLVRDRSGEKVW